MQRSVRAQGRVPPIRGQRRAAYPQIPLERVRMYQRSVHLNEALDAVTPWMAHSDGGRESLAKGMQSEPVGVHH